MSINVFCFIDRRVYIVIKDHLMGDNVKCMMLSYHVKLLPHLELIMVGSLSSFKIIVSNIRMHRRIREDTYIIVYTMLIQLRKANKVQPTNDTRIKYFLLYQKFFKTYTTSTMISKTVGVSQHFILYQTMEEDLWIFE
jgi:hypothetical protein